MTANLGWLPIGIPDLTGVTNPRPIVKEAWDKGKQCIFHYVDAYGKAVCGKATFKTRTLDHNGQSKAIPDIDDPIGQEQLAGMGLPCPDCYKVWRNGKSC